MTATANSTNTTLPLVSIVTPSLNMGAFIEETIQSVLAQDYANIEYIVMDGGSTDATLSLLRRYQTKLRWHSAPDAGTADAINNGFALSRGSILAFLAADDSYLPGAVSTAVKELRARPDVAAIYGEGNWVNERGEIIGRYPTGAFELKALEKECYICQPTAFFNREAFEAVGKLDSMLHYAFDWDLWIRLAKRYEMLKIDDKLATSRLHYANKTLGHPEDAVGEAVRVLRRHFGYVPFQWIYRYCASLLGEKIEFVPSQTPSLGCYCLSLPVGILKNRRRPLRYVSEWSGLVTTGGVARYLHARLSGRPRKNDDM
jgi:glycosyltransferase involved in cell wall biosynthesis